jgi:aryl-alcohol dehydrogenase-like predicted oxidoreductase
MKYRPVGNTGLTISEIGFGTGGTAGLMINGTYEEQRRTIARALDLGINYFDESPDYGDGVSETNLGRILKELGANPVITTNVEVREENLRDIAGHVERSVEASLARLGVDQVDFIQIHNGPTVERPKITGRDYRVLGIEDYLAKNGALEGLQRIRQSGKTRFIGFICRGNDAGPVRQLIDTGVFSLINIVYTLLNPTAVSARPEGLEAEPDWGQVIPYAREKGVGVAVFSGLAGGLLTDHALSGGAPHPLSRGGRGGGGVSDERQRQIARAANLRFLAKGSECTLAQAATRFILMEPGVTTVLGGFSDVDQLEEGAAASDMGPLAPDLIGRLDKAWRTNLAS